MGFFTKFLNAFYVLIQTFNIIDKILIDFLSKNILIFCILYTMTQHCQNIISENIRFIMQIPAIAR